jgi:hypothetical protein
MILSSPVRPTLTELWDGNATVEVWGPIGVTVELKISMSHQSGRVLAGPTMTVTLPVDTMQWRENLVDRIRESFQDVYDEAESCLISVSHPNLGTVSLQCVREFSPLRWATGNNRDGPFIRLIDNTDGAARALNMFTFMHPDISVALDACDGSRVRSPEGGLVIAASGAFSAAIILPPVVRTFDQMRVTPQLLPRPKSVGEILELIALSHSWTTASLPANPFGAIWRGDVLRAITAQIASVVGGDRWARIEQLVARYDGPVPAAELDAAIGDHTQYRTLAQDFRRQIDDMRASPPEDRAQTLTKTLGTHMRRIDGPNVDTRLATFILRLASEPGSLVSMQSDDLRIQLGVVLAWPVLLRVARFLVVTIHALEPDDTITAYRGWVWT